VRSWGVRRLPSKKGNEETGREGDGADKGTDSSSKECPPFFCMWPSMSVMVEKEMTANRPLLLQQLVEIGFLSVKFGLNLEMRIERGLPQESPLMR